MVEELRSPAAAAPQAGQRSALPRFEDRLELGEGPRWIAGALHLVDIPAGRLYRAEGDSLRLVFETPGLPLGAVAGIRGRAGKYLAAVGDGVAVIAPTAGGAGALHWLHRVGGGAGPAIRVNDGVADPAGRFWFGTMGLAAEPGAGALWRLDRDGALHRVLDDLTIPNGPAFSADGRTMLLADSAAPKLRRFALDDAGRIEAESVFGDAGERTPDGMVFDAEGMLWLAWWGEGLVERLGPGAEVLDWVRVAAGQSTAPAFGGEGLRTLFVTSARIGLERPGEDDGAVFAVELPVAGLPAAEYRPTAGAEAARC